MATLTKGWNPKKRVWFRLIAPEAKEVILFGSFNNSPRTSYPLKRGRNGIWRVCLYLEPGIYQYRFLVDGEWRKDPRTEEVSHLFDSPHGVRVVA